MTQEERIRAVIDCGFTERQARFLVLVMRHGGVCIPRQYASFAGIANVAGDATSSSTTWSSDGTPTRSGVCTTARGSITSITSRSISSSRKDRAATAGRCRRGSQSSA